MRKIIVPLTALVMSAFGCAPDTHPSYQNVTPVRRVSYNRQPIAARQLAPMPYLAPAPAPEIIYLSPAPTPVPLPTPYIATIPQWALTPPAESFHGTIGDGQGNFQHFQGTSDQNGFHGTIGDGQGNFQHFSGTNN